MISKLNLPNSHKTLIIISIIMGITLFFMNSCSSTPQDPAILKMKLQHKMDMEKARMAERDKFIKKGYSPVALSCMDNRYSASETKVICKGNLKK